MMEFTTYHKILRVSLAVMTCVLVFQSGVFSDVTPGLTTETARYMANAVGVTVGVAPTELNTITADLTKRETALAAREKALQDREISIGLNGENDGLSQTTVTFLLATVLFILLVLVILNYILDFVRARRGRAFEESSVPA
jgi:hypothetical protein